MEISTIKETFFHRPFRSNTNEIRKQAFDLSLGIIWFYQSLSMAYFSSQ